MFIVWVWLTPQVSSVNVEGAIAHVGQGKFVGEIVEVVLNTGEYFVMDWMQGRLPNRGG